jgi:hypothetical protein
MVVADGSIEVSFGTVVSVGVNVSVVANVESVERTEVSRGVVVSDALSDEQAPTNTVALSPAIINNPADFLRNDKVEKVDIKFSNSY